MHVLIVGCGIGGVTAAIALRRGGHRVTVVEQAPAPGEVGAGLQLAPNATRVLDRLGVLGSVRAVGVRPEARVVRNWSDGSVIHRKVLGGEVEAVTGAPHLVLHRADLLDALLGAAVDPGGAGPVVRIDFGHRVNAVEIGADSAQVRSDAGGVWVADAVIGADGIRSEVRRIIGGVDSPVYSGESMWRALIPAEVLDPQLRELVGFDPFATTLWAGPERHVVHYPLRGGQLVNIAATVPAPQGEESYLSAGSVEDMVASFAGWDERLLRLLGLVPQANLWPLLVRQPLNSWTAGRVALLGDACHPMLPYQAQGSAQAIEDAVVLADCLAGDDVDVVAALRRYEDLRKGRASAIQLASVTSGKTWSAAGPEGQRERDALVTKMGGNGGSVTYDWLWNGSPTESPQPTPL